MKIFKKKNRILLGVVIAYALTLNVKLFAGDEFQRVTRESRIIFSHPLLGENTQEVMVAGKVEKAAWISPIQSCERELASCWQVSIQTSSDYPLSFYFHTRRQDAQDLLDAVLDGMVIDISDCEKSLWEPLSVQKQKFETIVTERRKYFCSKTDWDTDKGGFHPYYPHVHLLKLDEVRWQDFITYSAGEDPNNYRQVIQ